MIDVEAFRAKQAEARKQGRYLGLGVTAYIEPTASGNFPPMATEAAQVRIGPDGKVAREGDQVAIGKDAYVSLCRRHWEEEMGRIAAEDLVGFAKQ